MCYTFKEVLISRLHEESKQLNINKINNQNKKWENNFSTKIKMAYKYPRSFLLEVSIHKQQTENENFFEISTYPSYNS